MPPRSVRRAGEPHADLLGSDTALSVPRRRMYQAHPTRGWRTLWSRAHSSRVYHTSYPVPVRRPARLDCAYSRRHRARHALAVLLAFGSADTWHGDFHPVSSVPCLAHTPGMSRAGYRVGSVPWLDSQGSTPREIADRSSSPMGIIAHTSSRGFAVTGWSAVVDAVRSRETQPGDTGQWLLDCGLEPIGPGVSGHAGEPRQTLPVTAHVRYLAAAMQGPPTSHRRDRHRSSPDRAD